MGQLGLINKDENGISFVTEGIAKDLAKAYQESIANTPYIKKSSYLQDTISIKDFNKSKMKISLEEVKRKSGEQERQLLKQIFFGAVGATLDDRTWLRRQTLGHILYVVNETNRRKHPVSLKDLDSYLVHYPHYFSLLKLDDKLEEYTCPAIFSSCHNLWKQFSLQHYFTQALESLFYAVLEIIGTESLGRTIQDVVSEILDDEDFFNTLSNASSSATDTPKTFLNALGVFSPPDHDRSTLYQGKFIPGTSAANENDILEMSLKSPSVMSTVECRIKSG